MEKITDHLPVLREVLGEDLGSTEDSRNLCGSTGLDTSSRDLTLSETALVVLRGKYKLGAL